tara:strand:+ start:76 stop:417 length:342 start_codon:yes stop_codon:yes gene_type:complete
MKNLSVVSVKKSNKKLKLYFTKDELTKLLQHYSIGVSKGKWKDYSINFTCNEAFFHFHRNTFEKPITSIIKNNSKKKQKNIYKLFNNNQIMLYDTLDNLFIYLRRRNIILVKR